MNGWKAYAAARTAMTALGWGPARIIVAEGFAARLVGMGAIPARAPDGNGYVLVFPRCHAVHTCFMGRALDIAFVGGQGRVLAHYEHVVPWRFLSCPDAQLVLERVAVASPESAGRPREPQADGSWCRDSSERLSKVLP